ncbi:MAG TPA: YugN family protein [Calditerricola sp.]
MVELEWALAGRSGEYGKIRAVLESEGFVLGGGWEYDHAYFDRELARTEGETVYLRVPLTAEQGTIGQDDARVRLGTPFVLNHVVHLGSHIDRAEAISNPFLNQFSPPRERDGSVTPEWVEAGRTVLARVSPVLDAALAERGTEK